MNVVAHQTERMDAVTEPAGPFLEKEKQAVAVVIAEEDRLPAIAAKDDMVESAWDMDTRFSGHGGDNTPACLFVNVGSLTHKFPISFLDLVWICV